MGATFTFYEEAETLEELGAKVRTAYINNFAADIAAQGAAKNGAAPRAAQAAAAATESATAPQAKLAPSLEARAKEDEPRMSKGATQPAPAWVCPEHAVSAPSKRGPAGSLYCPTRFDNGSYCKRTSTTA